MKYRRRSGGSEFLIDAGIDDQPAVLARAALQRDEFATIESFLAEAVDPNERQCRAEAVADWSDRSESLMAWLGQQPSANALAVNGINSLKWAWKARGGGSGATVSQEAAKEFASRLQEARELLLQSMRADARSVIAVPWLIAYARGAGDTELGDKALAEGKKRCPTLRAMYSSMLVNQLPRWFGTSEGAFDFARRVAHATPPSCGAAVVILEAHYWEADHQPPSYWLQPSVVDEVLTTARLLETNTDFAGLSGIRLRQWLAFSLWRCGHPKLAKPHFEVIRSVPDDRPWFGMRRGFNWLFSPFRKARRECLSA
jgi:hypothetical protein